MSERRRMMIEKYVWIKFGSGGSSNYNAKSAVNRSQKIYGIAFNADKSRYAYDGSWPPYNRIGFDWLPDHIEIKRVSDVYPPYWDSKIRDEGANNSRIWIDTYDNRFSFRKQPGSSSSGWLSFSNAGLAHETITLEDGTSVNVSSYRWNEADKLYSYDTSGPCPLYICQCGCNVDMANIYILVKKSDQRTSFNWY